MPLEFYGPVIIADRYAGSYSGGQWLAIDEPDDLRLADVESGAQGSDAVARAFWAHEPDWIAAGDTPNAALSLLIAKRCSIG